MIAALKTKYVRGNNAPFMNKELGRAIMERSKLLRTEMMNTGNFFKSTKERPYSKLGKSGAMKKNANIFFAVIGNRTH